MPSNSMIRSLTKTTDHARAARNAGLAFMNGATTGWGRAELAEWLLTHYAPAVHHVTRSCRRMGGEPHLEEENVARVVANARLRVARFLETITTTDPVTLTRDAIEQGIVVAKEDANGGITYVAISAPAMRLVPRVIGLFIADYLTHPEDYEEVVICQCCGMIGFGPAEVHAAWCEPTPNSGTFRRAAVLDAEPFPLVRQRVA